MDEVFELLDNDINIALKDARKFIDEDEHSRSYTRNYC